MRKLYYTHHLALFVILLTCTLQAQITISYSDLKTATGPGSAYINHEDTTTTNLNIGTTGATSWNFSSLLSQSTYNISYVTPASGTNAALFPAANVSQHFVQPNDGMPLDGYMFLQLSSTSYSFLGASMVMTIQPGLSQTILVTKSVPDNSLQLPCTFGATWSTTYSDTIKGLFNGNPVSTQYTNATVTNTVDAYGPVTFPGGTVSQALRIKRDKRSTTKFSPNGDITYSRKISYTVVTQDGVSFEITAKDTNAASSGTIQLGSNVSWTSRGSTAVQNETANVKNFRLFQNYPNPFNPETRIVFELPAVGKVELAIYNSVGQKVATLADGSYPAGTFEKSFNASGLPSGVYFSVLSAGNSVLRQKMVLLK